jgi:nicotinamidase/pyrazinamidase
MKIFYDVDTQNDFMNSNGALYVPGAEEIKPNIERLTEYARENQIPIWGSVDAHVENDPEFETFPPHCVVGTRGQEKIIPVLDNERYFEKAHYDVFTNSNAEKELASYGVDEAVVYGVATDICVRAAVLGMQQRGIQTFVVEDAIKGVFEDKTKLALEEMANAGAKFVTTKEVVGERK